MSEQTIAVVGATGFTGKLVVAALRSHGASVRAIGRNRQKLEALAAGHQGVEARASEWTGDALAEALRGCAAVVSCAGPFQQAGQPVVEAAIRARVPYCDSTGEQPFVRWVFEQMDAPARAAGVPVVTAAGYDYVPGDLGAAVVAEGMGPLDRMDVVYAPASAGTSVGTRVSSIQIMASPCVVLRDGRLQPARIGSMRRSVDAGFRRVTAGLIPTGEPLQVPRHVEVRNVFGYLSIPGPMNPGNRGAGAMVALMRLPGVMQGLESLARRGPEGPNEHQRDKVATCHVQARARDGSRRAVLLEGSDVYGFTADALAKLSLAMARGVDAVGACAPAQVVEPRAFLASTGWRVREVTPE